jgi:cobalt/nickel transport system permease protein
MLLRPLAMHIPDGFLSTWLSILLWLAALIVVGFALRRTSRDLGERQVPLMGVLAAAIFAGQMLNFSVTGGTSGHLLGAALATILLGPWPAVVVMTTVVSLQALIFQDGGLLALGANLFNMAVIGVSVSYFVFTSVRRLAGAAAWGLLAAGALAAWCSVFAASLSCALQLALSGTSPANIAVPAMAGIHTLIGGGEALITLGALTFLHASRRDLLVGGQASSTAGRAVWIAGLALALFLAVLSPLASAHPDGLEWVAERQGFLSAAREPLYELIPDYIFPGLSNETAATILAAVVGTLLVFGVVLGVGRLRRDHDKTA